MSDAKGRKVNGNDVESDDVARENERMKFPDVTHNSGMKLISHHRLTFNYSMALPPSPSPASSVLINSFN